MPASETRRARACHRSDEKPSKTSSIQLSGVLPKDYGIFEPQVLEDLMRLFNSEQIRNATGDVFGRIYEFF